MDRFKRAKSSGGAARNLQLAYYALPAFALTCVAGGKFMSNSFGIYLKY